MILSKAFISCVLQCALSLQNKRMQVPEYRLSHVIDHVDDMLPRVTDIVLFSAEVDVRTKK